MAIVPNLSKAPVTVFTLGEHVTGCRVTNLEGDDVVLRFSDGTGATMDTSTLTSGNVEAEVENLLKSITGDLNQGLEVLSYAFDDLTGKLIFLQIDNMIPQFWLGYGDDNTLPLNNSVRYFAFVLAKGGSPARLRTTIQWGFFPAPFQPVAT